MNNSFINQIQNWVIVDNEIKDKLKSIKKLREQRNSLVDDIFLHVKREQLEKTVIEISDGKLQFNENKTTSPLTFKLIRQSLQRCISNENEINSIINLIKEMRATKIVRDIKRTYT